MQAYLFESKATKQAVLLPTPLRNSLNIGWLTDLNLDNETIRFPICFCFFFCFNTHPVTYTLDSNLSWMLQILLCSWAFWKLIWNRPRQSLTIFAQLDRLWGAAIDSLNVPGFLGSVAQVETLSRKLPLGPQLSMLLPGDLCVELICHAHICWLD